MKSGGKELGMIREPMGVSWEQCEPDGAVGRLRYGLCIVSLNFKFSRALTLASPQLIYLPPSFTPPYASREAAH